MQTRETDSVVVEGALAYRPAAAARLLGVSRRTLDAWAADGLIQPLKVGPGRAGLVLYPRRELVAFLAREAAKQAAERQARGIRTEGSVQ